MATIAIMKEAKESVDEMISIFRKLEK